MPKTLFRNALKNYNALEIKEDLMKYVCPFPLHHILRNIYIKKKKRQRDASQSSMLLKTPVYQESTDTEEHSPPHTRMLSQLCAPTHPINQGCVGTHMSIQ